MRVALGVVIGTVLAASVVLTPGVASAEVCRTQDQYLCLTFSPASAETGARVTFTGSVDPKDLSTWRKAWTRKTGIGMYRDFPAGSPLSGCELSVSNGPSAIHLDTTTGEVSGFFVVGSHGNCMQQTKGYPTQPGRYYLTAGCTACVFAEYRILPRRLPATGSSTWPWGVLGLLLCVAGGALTTASKLSIGASGCNQSRNSQV